jgi:amino acid permease
VIGYYYFKQKERSGKALLNYLALPLIGLVIIAFVWINLNPSAKILGFVWLGIGLVILAIVSRGFRRVPPTLQV